MRIKCLMAAVIACIFLVSCSLLNPEQNSSDTSYLANGPLAEAPGGPGQEANITEAKDESARQATEAAAQAEAMLAAERERLAAMLLILKDAPLRKYENGDLRKFPYPYNAMAAITSDCDGSTPETFERMHRFLNTFAETPYGAGLGLDIADSFFVYNASNYNSDSDLLIYCEGIDPHTPANAAFIKKYYDCGWIDSMHSFGNFSRSDTALFTRELAIKAWDLLNEAGIQPTVWIDHGTETNVQNFGAYSPLSASSYQMGDNPKSPYYHTDITLANSVHYVWYSRHSDLFGYDFPLMPRILRDGSKVWGFHRYTNEYKKNGEIDWVWRPNRLGDQITAARLDALEKKGQYAIIAQHLTISQQDIQPQEADFAALRLLAERFHEQQSILVARTSRLLPYAVAQKYLSYQMAEYDGITLIRIVSILDPVTGARIPDLSELAGLTFYCDDPQQTVIFVGDTPLAPENIQQNPKDASGRASVSIPWFAQDTFDYTSLQ